MTIWSVCYVVVHILRRNLRVFLVVRGARRADPTGAAKRVHSAHPRARPPRPLVELPIR